MNSGRDVLLVTPAAGGEEPRDLARNGRQLRRRSGSRHHVGRGEESLPLKATTHRPNPTGARPSDRRLALPSCRRSANAIGILLLALGLAAPAIALAATTREPQLMLSWHAPYGMPRASETLGRGVW